MKICVCDVCGKILSEEQTCVCKTCESVTCNECTGISGVCNVCGTSSNSNEK